MRPGLATFVLCSAASGFTTMPGLATSQDTVTHRVPYAEYKPTGAIVLSAELFRFNYRAMDLAEAITRAGADVLVATSPDAAPLPFPLRDGNQASTKLGKPRLGEIRTFVMPHENIWIRDYGPVPVLSLNGTGVSTFFVDFRYDDGSPASDQFPSHLGNALHVGVEKIPAWIDGGNILMAGRTCITSTPLSKEQSVETEPGVLALKDQYASQLGCNEVIVLTDPPHPHVDMWIKPVRDDVLLVNELTAESMALAEKSGIGPQAQALRDNLNSQAAILSQKFHVIRIPMPLPHRGVFRTFTNSLLVNGHAIVPIYKKFGWDYGEYPDQSLESGYEAAAHRVYENLGFKVKTIIADGMIFNGGGLHCITLALPATMSANAQDSALLLSPHSSRKGF